MAAAIYDCGYCDDCKPEENGAAAATDVAAPAPPEAVPTMQPQVTEGAVVAAPAVAVEEGGTAVAATAATAPVPAPGPSPAPPPVWIADEHLTRNENRVRWR
jgi:hypothetical protein